MKLNLPAFALVLPQTVVLAAPKPPIKLTSKDFEVAPFTFTVKNKKLDPKDKTTFDELKVTTSDRIHILGKKKHESGNIGQSVYYHLEKVVTASCLDQRAGTLTAKIPSDRDSVNYFIVLDLGDDLKIESVALEKRKEYTWSTKAEAGQTMFRVMDGTKKIAVVSADETKVLRFGFAATARWVNNEVDLVATLDGENQANIRKP